MKDRLELPPGLEGNAFKVEKDSPGSVVRPHSHEELELNLVLSGKASYKLRDRRYELSGGALIWLFPDQSHMLVDFSAHYKMWVLVFRQGMLRRLCAKEAPTLLKRAPKGNYCRLLSKRDTQELDALYSHLASLTGRPFAFNPGLMFALATSWLAFGRASELKAESSIHPAVWKAASLIQKGRDGGKIGDLAMASGLSTSRLSRLFNSQMGVSVSGFRNSLRLDSFFRIMREGKAANVSEAAIMAGFGSYVQFHRAFKRATGRPPSEWDAGEGAPS